MTNSILSPISFTSIFDGATGEVIQADVYFYVGGTTTETPVYQDAGLGTGWAQPIRTTGYGRFPPIFIPEIASYRMMVYDVEGVLLEDEDGLPGAFPDPATVPPAIEIDSNGLVSTGDIVAAFAAPTTTRTGFVRCNGRTIGGNASNATERANDDTEDLFLYLWNQSDASGSSALKVYTSGGVETARGASAVADFGSPNFRQIALPDLRGRAIAGLDGMGHTAASRLTGTYWGASAVTLGAAGGLESHTLTTAQLATHLHANTAGSTQGIHQHTSYMQDHSHSYTGVSDLSATNFGLQAGSVNYERKVGLSLVAGALDIKTTFGVAAFIPPAANGGPTSLDSAGPITTTITNVNAGLSNPHNNTQPSMVMMFYMRL